MNFTPIAARSARWLSFVLAITLAFQFVSPLVFAAEPQFAAAFMTADSRRDNSLDDEEQLDEDFAADDEFFEDIEELDSAFMLDSMPLRAPGTEIDWRNLIRLTVTAEDKANTVILTLDSGSTAFLPVDKIDHIRVKGILMLENAQKDDLLTGADNPYVIKFPNLLKRTTEYKDIFTMILNGETIPVLHCGLPISEPFTFTAYMDEKAKQAFDIDIDFDFTMSLKALENQNPAAPGEMPLIELADGSSFKVKPYETGSTKPELLKSVSDNTRIADAGHPIEWELKYKTGRLTPVDPSIPYEHREIKIVDTIDTSKHTLDESNLKLKWKNNDGSTTVNPVLKRNGEDTKVAPLSRHEF